MAGLVASGGGKDFSKSMPHDDREKRVRQSFFPKLIETMHEFWALLFGAFLATARGFLRVHYERSQERKSLKAALAAEIRAILSIIAGGDCQADPVVRSCALFTFASIAMELRLAAAEREI